MLSKGGFVLAYMVVVGVGCTLPTAWAEAGKRSPVIIIPGDGGNQLEARLTDKPSVPHWWCSKTSDWFRLWLDPKQLLPLEVDCWADNMRMEFKPSSVAQGESPYVNAPGVETRVIDWGGTASLEYLDPTLEIGDSVMFGRVVDALVGAGGERGVSVRGAPYDFRRIPGDEYMSRMRTLVEDAVAANGGSPATLLTHSMGCLIALRFLRGLSAEWREVHIGHWLAVSAPWGGSEGIIRLFASGNNLGVSAVGPPSPKRSIPASALPMVKLK